MLAAIGFATIASVHAQPVASSTIIVRLRADASPKTLVEKAVALTHAAPGIVRVARAIDSRASALMSASKLDRYYLLTVPRGHEADAVEALRHDEDVEFVSENHRYRLDGSGFDPLAMQQWALRRIDAEGAWKLTLGSDSVIIGFVDTGVDFEHPDLAPSLWMNSREDFNSNGKYEPWPVDELRSGISGDIDGVDNDGNGYVDDVIGFDFVDQTVPNIGDWSVRDGIPNDEVGHGTAVAGVMSAARGNDIGISGIAPASPLMTLRAFDASGNAEDDDVAAAIVYAANNGVRVLNLSFGDTYYSPLMHDAIRYARARGVVIVASAGNEGSEEPHYPSSYPEVISVAMTDSNDFRNGLSNFGSQISVAAPGVEVYSSARDSVEYKLVGGTSIAAPYVSGVAALVLSRHPSWSPDEVRGVIELTADDHIPKGWDPFYGAGRINARRAVEMEGPVLLAIDMPSSESGLGRDSAYAVLGSVQSPFMKSWRLYYGMGESPGAGDWNPLTPEEHEGRINATLGRFDTRGIADTVVTLRLVLEQANGRSTERRARILLDRSAPRFTASDIRNVWRFDERAVAITASTDDRSLLSAMVRRSGTSEPYREIAFESERTGLVQTHYLVLGPADLERATAYDLFLVAENASGDTAMIGSPSASMAIERDAEAFPLRGFNPLAHALPYGFMLNEVVAMFDTSDRTIALNRFSAGTFGKLVLYSGSRAGFVAIDSLSDEWIPKDFGDTDGDGLIELLAQNGASTRIYEQSVDNRSVLASIMFDDANATDATLRRTAGADLVDVDGDGRDELIGQTDFRTLTVVDGDTLPPHYFIAKNENGVFRVVARLLNPTEPGFGSAVNQYGVPNAVVADFNADGNVDIVIGDDDADFLLYSRDEQGAWRLVWSEENEGKGASQMIARGDVDGDGRPEVLTGYRSELTIRNSVNDYYPPFWTIRLTRFDGSAFTPTTVWQDRVAYVRPTEPFRAGASFGDLDGNARDEIAMSVFPSMYVFRWSATKRTLEPLWMRFGSVNNQPIIADFDRDGIAELGVGDGQNISFHQIDMQYRGPDVPAGVAGWSTSDSTVHIEWDSVAGADEYRIYRGAVDPDVEQITLTRVAISSRPSFDDTGADLAQSRLIGGTFYAYAVTAVDVAATPDEGGISGHVVVFTHASAHPTRASALSDSSIIVDISAPVRESLYRQGAFDIRSVASDELQEISSITYAGDSALVIHLANPAPGDSLAVKLTRLFRDAFGSPPDTSVSVGIRLPVGERIDERFIATMAVPIRDSDLRIVVTFNAAVDVASASDERNYVLRPIDTFEGIDADSAGFTSAQVDPTDSRRVILTVRPGYPIGALGRNYTVTIRNVRSADGRSINNGTESVVGFVIEGIGFEELRVYPHPFSISLDEHVIFAGLPRDASVQIMDRNGGAIRLLRETEHNGGVAWDGRDESGTSVASGIYIYRVTIGKGTEAEESELGKIAVVP